MPGSVPRRLLSPTSCCSSTLEHPCLCCTDAQKLFTCHEHQGWGWAKTILIHFDILVFYQCSLASLWAFGFILHQTTQRRPGAGCQMCSVYFCSLIACDGSSQTETSWEARTTLPAALHAVLWVTLSKQFVHMCDTSGSYFGDELVVPPSIWVWDAKSWSKHLRDQQVGCWRRNSRCELGMWGSQDLQRYFSFIST